MNLTRLITSELQRIGRASGAGAPAPVIISHPDGTPTVRLELQDLDRYSATLLRLSVSSTGRFDDAGQPAGRLHALAQRVIEQLRFLEEPLALTEADVAEQIAQVRSNPPQRDDEGLVYWEAQVSAGAHPMVSLTRYHWTPELAEREVLPYPATFSQLGRITESLAAALAE